MQPILYYFDRVFIGYTTPTVFIYPIVHSSVTGNLAFAALEILAVFDLFESESLNVTVTPGYSVQRPALRVT
jgi:hypothetical protein